MKRILITAALLCGVAFSQEASVGLECTYRIDTLTLGGMDVCQIRVTPDTRCYDFRYIDRNGNERIYTGGSVTFNYLLFQWRDFYNENLRFEVIEKQRE